MGNLIFSYSCLKFGSIPVSFVHCLSHTILVLIIFNYLNFFFCFLFNNFMLLYHLRLIFVKFSLRLIYVWTFTMILVRFNLKDHGGTKRYNKLECLIKIRTNFRNKCRKWMISYGSNWKKDSLNISIFVSPMYLHFYN